VGNVVGEVGPKGRKRENKERIVCIRVTEEEFRKLEEMARQARTDKSKLIRAIIGLKTHVKTE
jgi:hypothetical protein